MTQLSVVASSSQPPGVRRARCQEVIKTRGLAWWKCASPLSSLFLLPGFPLWTVICIFTLAPPTHTPNNALPPLSPVPPLLLHACQHHWCGMQCLYQILPLRRLCTAWHQYKKSTSHASAV
jgi:hypothetical protein